MGKRTDAYVDTSAFIAFVDRSDTHHPLFRRLFSGPPAIITTTLVAEGHAWFLRRHDRTRALQFVSMIEGMKPLVIAPVGAAEQAGAARLPRRFSDQDLTLTDAVGQHLMQAKKVKSCWSTNFHRGLTGVSLVVNEN